MTNPDIFHLLTARGVRFALKNKGLSYHSEKAVLMAEEVLWIEQNRDYIATFLLEKRLSLKRYLYEECVGFERKPFYRPLSRECVAAGRDSIQRLTAGIKQIEQQIERLKKSHLS